MRRKDLCKKNNNAANRTVKLPRTSLLKFELTIFMCLVVSFSDTLLIKTQQCGIPTFGRKDVLRYVTNTLDP